MTILPLVIEPDPRLHIPSVNVPVVDDGVRAFVKDMFETMYANDGLGLAAVQVGVHKKVIVIDVAQREGGNDPRVFINAEIVTKDETPRKFLEGCLSFPDQFAEVERPDTVRVRYLDEKGTQQEIDAGGLLATCLQHEIDHTNGIVFTDHLSKLKRDMIVKKLTKLKKLGMISDMPHPKEDNAAL
ncbi:MAG: peptide deformylase [Rickettsiales bacterium]